MTSGRATADRVVSAIAAQCARAQDPLDLLERVATLVRHRVPYAAAGWILVDPDTLLMNGVYAEGVDRQAHLELIAAEQGEDADVNRFVDLARSGVIAASLSGATDGDLTRSSRWRTVYQPRGYGDELRTVFATGSVTWGHACLTRSADQPTYDAAEIAFVARIGPHVAHGIRTGLVTMDPPSVQDEPGLLVLDDDGSVESMTPNVTEWFGDPEDPSLRTTIVLHEVAQRARLLAAEQSAPAPGPAPARAVARTRAGESVVVRGTRLVDPDTDTGRTALVIDPPSRGEAAPLLMHLHQLTGREREVTRLLLTGLSTHDIAAELWITPETLRGHVKSVLAKMAVSSRAELFAKLSPEPRSRTRPAAPAGRSSQ